MNILYDRKVFQEETFTYKINQGGELDIKVSNGTDRHVVIVFSDKKFSHVHFVTGGEFDRSTWHIFGAIAKEIERIESDYNAPKEQVGENG